MFVDMLKVFLLVFVFYIGPFWLCAIINHQQRKQPPTWDDDVTGYEHGSFIGQAFGIYDLPPLNDPSQQRKSPEQRSKSTKRPRQ